MNKMDPQLSKSEKKRRAKSIEQLVNELAALPGGEIAVLPCEQEVIAEIFSARNLKGGTKKRQLKYVTKLLRDKPVVDELYDFLARRKGSRLKQNREFHNLEYMRNLLISEAVQEYEDLLHNDGYINDDVPFVFSWDSRALKVISEQLPDIDQDLLKSTVLQFARTRNRKFSRMLFRILKSAFEKAQYAQIKDRNNGI